MSFFKKMIKYERYKPESYVQIKLRKKNCYEALESHYLLKIFFVHARVLDISTCYAGGVGDKNCYMVL